MASVQPNPDAAAGGSGFRASLRQNLLALISLGIALFGLGYNTWRNETTERHRNVRQSAFVLLSTLGELQQLADTRYFGGERSESNRIAIWGRITLVHDIAGLVSSESAARAEALFDTWSAQAGAFDRGDAQAEKAVAESVRAARAQALADLRALR